MSKNFDKTLKLTVDILNKNKINYWICHGTLLGLIRNKKLISKTSDIDIGIWKNGSEKKKIIKIFKKKNFKIKKKFFKNDGLLTLQKKNYRDIDISFYESTKNEKEVFFRNYHFRNFICRIIDVLAKSKKYNGNYSLIVNRFSFLEFFARQLKRYLIKKNYFYAQFGYFVPKKFFLNLMYIKIYNLQIRVPRYYYDYLRCVYGQTWRQPAKNFNWIKDSPCVRKIK